MYTFVRTSVPKTRGIRVRHVGGMEKLLTRLTCLFLPWITGCSRSVELPIVAPPAGTVTPDRGDGRARARFPGEVPVPVLVPGFMGRTIVLAVDRSFHNYTRATRTSVTVPVLVPVLCESNRGPLDALHRA